MKSNYYPSGFPWSGKHHLQHTTTRINRLSKQLLPKESYFQKMMSSIVVLVALALSFNSYAQVGTIQIGSGNATAQYGNAIPVTNYDYTYSQQIVSAADYAMGGGAAGTITKIRYKFTSIGAPANWDDWTVYIGNTTKTEFTSDTDWVPLAQLTPVFTGTVVAVANNWFEITFNAPFNYTGGNLVVAVDENALGWTGSPEILSYNSSANAGILIREDGNNPDPASPASATTRVSLVPQLQFEGTQASCPPPTALNLTALTDNSASLAWLEAGTSTNWDVEFGPAGFTPSGTATDVGVSNPFVKTGLTANTSYQYYVKSVCGPADESAWVGPFSFTTPCVAAIIPFFEGFESGYTAEQNIAGCWIQESVGSNQWVANDNYTSYNRAPRTGSWDATLIYDGDSWLFRPMSLVAGTVYMVKFYARQDYNAPGSAVIKSSFGLAPDDASMTSVVVPSTDLTLGNYQEFIGYFTPATSDVYYLGIHATVDFSPWYATLDDISVEVAPTCPAPTALTVSGTTSTTATLAWTENGSSSDWDIEYGLEGFTPTGVPTLSVTTNPTTITGLTDNTEYSFYVRSVCGLTDQSAWSGPYSFATLCSAISAIAFCEDFEDTSTSLACWRAINANGDSEEWSIYLDPVYSNSGSRMAGLFTDGNYGDNDDYLITPNITLTGNEVMKFAYRVMDASEPNDFQVLLSTTGTSIADFTDTIMHLGSYSNVNYKDTSLDLSAYTGNVYIAFHVPPGGLDGWYLFIDDVCFDICIPAPGVSGSLEVCALDQTLDLNTVITQGETNGVWEYAANQAAINGSDLALGAIPFGTSTFNYLVTTGCTVDTTTATITIVAPSSAGNDGSLAVCRNEPFNLLAGLSGNADMGGTWTDPNAVVVPNGNAVSGNIPGQYNFKYIVSNGVCPADTAKVVVNVQGCDFTVGVADVVFEEFKMYPNPTSDIVFISNTGSTEVFNYEVLDMNGRVILKANNAINGNSTTEINLNTVEVGVYMVRVFNEQAEKTFRIVKN